MITPPKINSFPTWNAAAHEIIAEVQAQLDRLEKVKPIYNMILEVAEKTLPSDAAVYLNLEYHRYTTTSVIRIPVIKITYKLGPHDTFLRQVPLMEAIEAATTHDDWSTHPISHSPGRRYNLTVPDQYSIYIVAFVPLDGTDNCKVQKIERTRPEYHSPAQVENEYTLVCVNPSTDI